MLRVIFTVVAVAATLWILYALRGVILLVVLAIFFAYLVAPLVDCARGGSAPGGVARLERRARETRRGAVKGDVPPSEPNAVWRSQLERHSRPTWNLGEMVTSSIRASVCLFER